MLRLIGMLMGSALAIAVLIVALGVPRLRAPDPEPVPELADEAPVIAEQQPEMTAAGASGNIAESGPADSVAEPESYDQAAAPEPEVAALVDQVFAPEETRTVVTAAEPEPVPGDRWYAFWSPFRSELAANGFVAQLQDSTGIDYRVVKVKTGVYEVAFAYSDEADIQAKLERIAAATGLDMTGG